MFGWLSDLTPQDVPENWDEGDRVKGAKFFISENVLSISIKVGRDEVVRESKPEDRVAFKGAWRAFPFAEQFEAE